MLLWASKERPCIWYGCGAECGGINFTSLSQSGADKGASWVFKMVFEKWGMDGSAVDLGDDEVFFGGSAPPWSRVSSRDLVDLCLLVVLLFVFVTPPGVFFLFFDAFLFVFEGPEGITNICGASVFHLYAEMVVCTPCVVVEGAAGGGGVCVLCVSRCG